MKKLLSLLGLFGLTLTLGGCTQATPETTTSTPFKIGVILPLSGPYSSIGTSMEKGLQMALAETTLDEDGEIEVIVEDNASTPKNTVTAFQKLKDVDEVDVMITAFSSFGNPVAPLVETEQIPTISIANDAAIVDGRSWIVNLYTSVYEEITSLINEMQTRGYQNIAKIITIDDWGLYASNLFDERLDSEDTGINVVLSENFNPNETQFKSYIARLRDLENVDGILVIMMPGQLGPFAKQVREAGIDLPIFGLELFEDPNEVELSEGALIGSWYVNAANAREEFLDEFFAANPEGTALGVPNLHDAIALFILAFEENGNDLPAINNFLHNVQDFAGALGTYSSSGRNDFDLPAEIKVVTETGFEKLYK